MMCAEVQDRLDEYVDSGLTEADLQEIELHLHGCAECRGRERELRALLAEAAALPREVPPPRNLWPGIAGRIAARAVVPLLPRRSRWSGAGALAAAAALVAVGAVVVRTPVPARRMPGSPGYTPVSYESTSLGDAEREYVRATSELMAVVDARRSSLSPETAAVVDENLKIIDGALGELRRALQKDPGNPDLAHMLRATHQRKVDVLRRVVKL